MSKNQKGLTIFVLVFFFVCFAAVTTAAEESVEYNPGSFAVADVTVGPHGLTFQPKVEYGSLVLTVSRPDGEVISKSFASGTTPYLELSGDFIDGSYNYELKVIPKFVKRERPSSVESKGARDREARTQSGAFFVSGGRLVTPTEGAEVGIAKPLDQLILDDLIVTGSACIGFDCMNGENFGFDTLRLKENNLRIKFQDTSTSASFPSNDWQITANDSANGGANKFSIDDIDSGKTPFTIEAGTRANALYVDDSGRVGLGTSTPAEDLHIWYGDTPTVRLHQSGSGWAPQTWDIAGNEANFFIRDVTNGSNLPFRIQPGAPSNSLYIASDGDIGIGTASPSAKFYINADSSTPAMYVKTNSSTAAVMKMERDAGAITKIAAANNQGQFGTENDHPLNILQNNQTVMTVTDGTAGSTLLTMKDGGTYNGTWNSASSRELKENITGLALEDAISTLEGLEPVRYNYKGSKEEEHVGFIAEDVPDLVANNGRKNLSPMDIVAILTKVVKEQQKTISELKQEILKDK